MAGRRRRIGNQTPTYTYAAQYEFTEGALAAEYAEAYGLPPHPWQRTVLDDWLAVDRHGTLLNSLCILPVQRQNGKALALETEIPTPDGWKRMGDIHMGDYVFGQDGKPSMVLVESELFDKPMYRVTFEDHATIRASEDHVWTVRANGRNMDVTTGELCSMVSSGHVSVPVCEPVEYDGDSMDINLLDVHDLVLSGKPLPDRMLVSSVHQRSDLVYVFTMAYGVGLLSRRTPTEAYDLSCVPESQVWQLVEIASSLGMVASATVDGYRTYHVTILPIAGT